MRFGWAEVKHFVGRIRYASRVLKVNRLVDLIRLIKPMYALWSSLGGSAKWNMTHHEFIFRTITVVILVINFV